MKRVILASVGEKRKRLDLLLEILCGASPRFQVHQVTLFGAFYFCLRTCQLQRVLLLHAPCCVQLQFQSPNSLLQQFSPRGVSGVDLF